MWGRLAAVLLALGSTTFVHGNVPAAQRQALVELYTSANGSSWTYTNNWLNGDPCTNFWASIQCNQNQTTVTYVRLV
jgi:hypothetical protein